MYLSKDLEKRIEAFYMDLSTFMYTRGNILRYDLTSDPIASVSALLADREMKKATEVLCANDDEAWISGLYQAQQFLLRDQRADTVMLLLSGVPFYQKQETEICSLLARVDAMLMEVECAKKSQQDVEVIKPTYTQAFEQPAYQVSDTPWLNLESECYDAQVLYMAYAGLASCAPNLMEALEYQGYAQEQEERLTELMKRRTREY
ncbi:MAG: hypothetical protein RLZ35_1057 [Pseudomonadota bacterium]|jgi:hypothetical protein